ncbi:GntR family transcriptional regulator [Brevibacillus sp. B_LB10_24]|uniref:GntR family transcriptional regulator n=1 Tax=Brevibacillus sp. B_LB10_24 TaxID=3380645 RepID=UPI0038BDED35
MTEKKQSTSKQALAYQVIYSRIVEGEYPPGQRLVVDQIARELSMSPIPVREAIRQLESDGLVTTKHNSGAIVALINEQEYFETMELLSLLEGYAIALSSLTFPADKIDNLRNINQQMKGALEDFDFVRFGELNKEFHFYTYEFCPNKLLTDHIRHLWSRLDTIRRAGSMFIPSRAKESIQEHEVIISLLEEKRPFSEIEQYARMHKLNTLQARKKLKESRTK